MAKRGWHNEPMRHSLASHGVSTTMRSRGQAKLKSVHDRIWDMSRKNTGSHFLDSGSAYGYIYQNQIKEEGLFRQSDELRYVISTPHWLENILEVNDETEDMNKKLRKIISDGGNNSYSGDVDELIHDLRKEGHHVEVVWNDNTYNHENDFNQDFQFTIFRIDSGDNYIALQTHNGCDIRGGYPAPEIFKIEDMDYFSDWGVKYYGECDVDTSQTKLGGGYLEPQYADYDDIYDYSKDFEKVFKNVNIWNLKDDELDRFVSPDGAIICPKCGKKHITPSNPVIDGW